MLCFPNCKINLGLYVTERRDDGYHNIETVFYPLPWEDVLEIVPSDKTELHLHGKSITGDSKSNLVLKAFALLKEQFGDAIPNLDIHLLKNIPMGAGLGGGSSDGAFMLKLLNDYCNLDLDDKTLAALALRLGSDCPFFIHNTPQFAEGRGEQMTPIPLDLSGYSIQVICPRIHVATATAFKSINPRPAQFDLRKLDAVPVTQWKQHIHNDFEKPVFRDYPQIASIKDYLYAEGALFASMSGSGSSVFGIFEKGKKAETKSYPETFYI
ncbi:MAG: 4-(cytidine 5'-diphospho)-2-C-methyl-D-erythritol kinase [Bacteroidetes bacterium]|nr:4-(cytidine 5'-diphospho)-2-C-methyl-D-erythritol kinase [Bacteroidota bacterium]